MTVLEKNQKLLRESAAITGRTLKEDGTVVNLADLAAEAAALVSPTTGLPIAQGVTGDAVHVLDTGLTGRRHDQFVNGVDVVVPGAAVIATDVITIGTAITGDFIAGQAVILDSTDFTEATGQSLDGVQMVLTNESTTTLTLDDGSGTVVDIDATGTATGTAAFVKGIAFTQGQNVRRYRVKAEAVSGGGYVKWVEDAANALQAGAWLLDPVSTGSLNHQRIEDSAGSSGGWSEWKELSKDADDDSLSNLYFAGDNTPGVWNIWVEAEG